MRKIPGGSEAANILVGQVDFIDQPISVFARLNHPLLMGDLTEVALPTRYGLYMNILVHFGYMLLMHYRT